MLVLAAELVADVDFDRVVGIVLDVGAALVVCSVVVPPLGPEPGRH